MSPSSSDSPSASVFDPSDYLSGLDWDLDADNISGNDGDPVTFWPDVGPDGLDYGQGGLASSTNPTLKKAIYNGNAAVRFTTDDKLVNDPAPRGTGSANTLIIVCTPSSTTNSYLIGGNQIGGGPGFISGFGGKAFEYWSGNGAERATLATTASGLHILTVARSDSTGNVQLYYDGTALTPFAVNNSANWSGFSYQEIGANGNLAGGDDFFNGDICMILHFNQNHAGASGLDDLHDALKTRYGIS